MVMNEERWTVLDARAVTSIREIGYRGMPDDSQRPETWLPYLQCCREIAVRTTAPLRTVDRALYAAKGSRALPDRQ
jgi:hypothetical protein